MALSKTYVLPLDPLMGYSDDQLWVMIITGNLVYIAAA